MISVYEVFLSRPISSIDDIEEQERRNLNAYFLDHFGFQFRDVHSRSFNVQLENAIMNTSNAIDIPIRIARKVQENKEAFEDDVMFYEV